MKVYVDAVSVVAPGLQGWQKSRPVLAGNEAYEHSELEKYKPMQLPPNEARRATELVRMAFRVAEDLMANCTADLSQCFNVFATSGGDYPIIDQICRALCEPERLVSPTQFHNSVHNSAAGYWSIATHNRAPSTSISAHNDSFIMGLCETITMTLSEKQPSLLVCYDIRPPEPLQQKRAITQAFGMALLIQPFQTENSMASITLRPELRSNDETICQQSALEPLRTTNPAARALPLLELLAANTSATLGFRKMDGQSVGLEVNSCQ